MIFNTWPRFHAATDIDSIRMNLADRLGDIVDPQARPKESILLGVDPVEPFPREHADPNRRTPREKESSK